MFGLDKCAKATFKRGRLKNATNIDLDTNTAFKDIEEKDTHKYLGVHGEDGIQHSSMKEIWKDYKRVEIVLKSELNVANKFEAINTLTMPVVTHSFSIINRNLCNIRRLHTEIKKKLNMEKMHHSKADVDRLCLATEGERGLVQLELTYETTKTLRALTLT